LEPYTGSGSGLITVFVNVSYFDGRTDSSIPGVNNNASLATNLTTLSLSGGLNMGGNEISSIGRLSGLAGLWSIESDGTIKTEGLVKNIITSYQNEKIETTSVTSANGVFVTLVGTSELQNGTAEIIFEDISPTFNDITSNTAPINVVVTPNGPVTLYISEKDNNGFTIQQINGSNSGTEIDWIVTAYRKDYEPVEETPEVVIIEPVPTPVFIPAPAEVPETTEATNAPETAEATGAAEASEATEAAEAAGATGASDTTTETPVVTETTTETVVGEETSSEATGAAGASEAGGASEATTTTETVSETQSTGETAAPASSESPAQSSGPTAESDGGASAEPASADSASTNSSTQTDG